MGGWQKEKREREKKGKKNVLSCFVQLKSVLLISCVFWIY